MEIFDFIGTKLADFLTYTGFANAEVGNWVMILVGAFCVVILKALLIDLPNLINRRKTGTGNDEDQAQA